jgi:RecA-family ATPase
MPLDCLPENLAQLQFTIPTKEGPVTEQQDPQEAGDLIVVNPLPPTKLRKYDRTLASAEAKEWLNKNRLLTYAGIKQLPEPEWLVDRYLPEDSYAGLFGEFSGGKSFLALDWALSVATGEPWLGREVKQGDVVYIYAEGAGHAKGRIAAWLKSRELVDLPGSFQMFPCAIDVPNMEMLALFAALIRSAGLSPKLIIVDTLNQNFGSGDENSAQDTKAFNDGCMELRREFEGATVLVVHHTGHEAKKGSRGSTALPGAMDIAFTASKPGGKSSLGITLKNSKPHKDSAGLEPLYLLQEEVDLEDGRTSCVIRLANEKEVRRQVEEEGEESPRAAKIGIEPTFQALLGLMPTGGTHKVWWDASGKPKPTFNKHRTKLIEAGRVKLNEDGLYVVAVPSAAMH